MRWAKVPRRHRSEHAFMQLGWAAEDLWIRHAAVLEDIECDDHGALNALSLRGRRVPRLLVLAGVDRRDQRFEFRRRRRRSSGGWRRLPRSRAAQCTAKKPVYGTTFARRTEWLVGLLELFVGD